LGFNARYLRDYVLRGFNRYTLCLLKELQKYKHLELVLFTDQHSPVHSIFAKAIDAEIVNINSNRVLIWEHIRLPLAIRRSRIGVFHAPADGGLPAWKTCPYVLTYHRALDLSLKHWIKSGDLSGRISDYSPGLEGWRGLYHRYRHGFLRLLYLRAADRIIAVSQYGKWELVELLGVAAEKVEVIYEAAGPEFSENVSIQAVSAVKRKYSLPEKYLLFVSGFEPWKNVSGLLRAYTEARKTGIEEGLVLVGSGGDVGAARQLAEALELQEGHDVIFLERIHEDLPAIYRGATAFITLSWGESFGLPVVEAMRCGTPVIASNRAAIPEIVGDGGLLVDPGNQGDVVEALQAVTTLPDLQGSLRAKALLRSNFFSWEKTAQETARVYESVLDRSMTRNRQPG
jgi:glycosyltransferase involved in cell wall biosynthesis